MWPFDKKEETEEEKEKKKKKKLTLSDVNVQKVIKDQKKSRRQILEELDK